MIESFAKYGGSGLIPWGHESVVHPLALASRGHNAGPAEVGQMAGNLRLADAKDLDEIADADLFIRDEVQQTEACGVRQCAEEEVERESRLSLYHAKDYTSYMP
jgi:hypothetical protein